MRFLAVGCGLNKAPDGGLGVTGALPRRWLRVKQGGGCGLNKAPDGGPERELDIALVVCCPTRNWYAIKGCYETPTLKGHTLPSAVLVDVSNRIDDRLFRV